jgi:hypothetical protein
MAIKLNIINFNSDIENDMKHIKKIESVIDEIKDNIGGKYYVPYKNIINKMSKFIDMMVNTFQKEMEEVKNNYEYEENNEEDDDISITSISEYENDDTYEDENIQIKKLQKELDLKMNIIKNRFDFEYSKLFDL